MLWKALREDALRPQKGTWEPWRGSWCMGWHGQEECSALSSSTNQWNDPSRSCQAPKLICCLFLFDQLLEKVKNLITTNFKYYSIVWWTTDNYPIARRARGISREKGECHRVTDDPEELGVDFCIVVPLPFASHNAWHVETDCLDDENHRHRQVHRVGLPWALPITGSIEGRDVGCTRNDAWIDQRFRLLTLGTVLTPENKCRECAD